jgi:hypothetical protein
MAGILWPLWESANYEGKSVQQPESGLVDIDIVLIRRPYSRVSDMASRTCLYSSI